MDKHKKKIAWLLLIIWMIVIFLMSHQPGEISSSQSDLVLKFFRFIGIELNDYFGELATFIVRKTAHFSEYMILFFLAYNVLKNYINTRKGRLLLIVFVFLFILAKSRITDFGILVVLSIAIISTIIFCTYTIIETIEKNS